MLFLILFVLLIVVAFICVQQLDRRRWHRYQIERDLYFHQYPYVLEGEQKFEVYLPVSQNIQRKLMNTLMLTLQKQSLLKKVIIQREAEQKDHPFLVRVMIHDLNVGYLELKYAEQLCKILRETDFVIGRPIEVMAELSAIPNIGVDLTCRVRLDLPKNLKLVKELIKEKKTQVK